jgi:hypothetical protein
MPINKANLKHLIQKKVPGDPTTAKTQSQNIESKATESALNRLNLGSLKMDVKHPRIMFGQSYFHANLRNSMENHTPEHLTFKINDRASIKIIKSSKISRRSSKTDLSSSKADPKFRLKNRKGTPFNPKLEDDRSTMRSLTKKESPALTLKPNLRGPFSSVGAQTRAGRINDEPKANQDTHVLIKRLLDRDDCSFVAVFDGHGRAGGEVSAFLASSFPGSLS